MKIEAGKDYIGEVINSEDPTFTGRCKVKVMGLFTELPEENIPWFVPMNSGMFSGSGAGTLSVPKKGSFVRVRFSNADPYSGEYCAIQNIDPDLIEQIKDDYEGTQVIAYDSDAELLILYQNMTGLKILYGSADIIMNPSGDILMSHGNGRNHIEIKNDDIIITTSSSSEGGSNSTGKISISSGNEITLSAPNITLNSKNIKLGTGAGTHMAVAEKLIPILQQIVTEVAAKTPQGSTLVGNMFSQVKSKVVTTGG